MNFYKLSPFLHDTKNIYEIQMVLEISFHLRGLECFFLIAKLKKNNQEKSC